jgi:phosphoglycerate dehydrogenase-like enzyme
MENGMRIMIAGTDFPDSGRRLREQLPEDEIFHCLIEGLAAEAREADVLIPCMTRIGAEIIEKSSLRLIQQWGVGLEGVDLEAAARAGVPVCNVPADVVPANAEGTAEQALFLMMAVSRRFKLAQKSFQAGPWGFPEGRILFGGTALIVGLGRVGQTLAVKLRALGMKVMATKGNPEPGLAESLGLEMLGGPGDLAELLPLADFVISTVTAAKGTIGLFGRETFGRMKPGAVFVNVSRGIVVDEAALLEALDSGHLGGAGLDVFAGEPVGLENPLTAHEKVVAMPHTGGVTRECFSEIARVVAENIDRVRRREKPLYRANNGAY